MRRGVCIIAITTFFLHVVNWQTTYLSFLLSSNKTLTKKKKLQSIIAKRLDRIMLACKFPVTRHHDLRPLVLTPWGPSKDHNPDFWCVSSFLTCSVGHRSTHTCRVSVTLQQEEAEWSSWGQPSALAKQAAKILRQ